MRPCTHRGEWTATRGWTQDSRKRAAALADVRAQITESRDSDYFTTEMADTE